MEDGRGGGWAGLWEMLSPERDTHSPVTVRGRLPRPHSGSGLPATSLMAAGGREW